MTKTRRGVLLLAGLLGAAPAARADSPGDGVAGVVLRDPRGAPVELAGLVRAHKLTVVVFYAATCPCFAAHVERLQRLAADLGPRGVGFLVVDSERHAGGDPPAPAQIAPGLPVFHDEGGALAHRLGARYATESDVFDAAGRLRYRGGVDSDRKYLRPDAQPYLRQALERLLAGDAPALTTTKALGCALRLF